MSAVPKLHVCTSCARPGERGRGVARPGTRLFLALRERLAGAPVTVAAEPCLGPCEDACNVVLDLGGRDVFAVTRLDPERDAEVLAVVCAGSGAAEALVAAFPGAVRRVRGWKR